MPRDQSQRILIADDDASCREALVECFRRDGWTVAFACSGSEAIEVLRCTTVDVSVMDVHMPGMDGPEVLRTLLQERRAQYEQRAAQARSRASQSVVPPTVFVSSDPAAEQAVRALTANAPVDFIPKPVQLTALRHSLASLLGRKL